MIYTVPYAKIIEQSLSELVDLDKIRHIASNLPVFISSRITGLENLRKYFAEKLIAYGFPVLGWEVGQTFGTAQTATTRSVYLDNLKKASVYIGILDLEYGQELDGLGVSATEDEYNHAVANQKEIVLFVSRKAKIGKALELEKKWMATHTVGIYEDGPSLEKSFGDAINTLILSHSENWIMLGDLVMNAPYSEINELVTISKATSRIEMFQYFDSLSVGDQLEFVDPDLGEVTHLSLVERTKVKRFAGVFEYTLKLQKLPRLERMSWAAWGNYIDMDLNTLETISGEPHLRQAILLSLNVNKGEILMAHEAGSNLYNICKSYSDSLPLFRILATIDIVEAITSTTIEFLSKKPIVRIPCVEKVFVQKISGVEPSGLDVSMRVSIKGREDLLYERRIEWKDED